MRLFTPLLPVVLSATLFPAALAAGEPAPWQAPPGDPATKRPARVRIVKQGLEHQRTYDGNAFGISAYHRFRFDRASGKDPWKRVLARDDIEQFHDFDVDGDGKTEDDVVACHPFSLERDRPLTPVAPFYDLTVGSQRFYGGCAIFQADAKESGFSEDGMNDGEEGPPYQPRRNWTYFHESYEIFSPYRMYMVCLWQKHDFMNGGAENRVSFDAESELAYLVMRYYMGIEGFRFVVRNGEKFFISERVFQGAGEPFGNPGGKAHTIRPASEKWAEYGPRPPYLIAFDPAKAQFEPRAFDDVTAVGWYLFKDRLISGYVGHKWYAFEADAVVDRPARPSETLAMARIEAPGVPAFYIAACETPYELWRKVHKLGRSNAFARDPRGANFEKRGDMGSMDYADKAGRYLSHSGDEPVTDITLPDALAWCNQLSVMESKTPCYYEDPEFKVFFREVKQSPMYARKRALPKIHVNWAADGYRLPTPQEWAAAAAGEKPAISPEPGGKTAPVGAGPANAKGLRDLFGSVWELAWTFGDAFDPEKAGALTALGGSFLSPADPLSLSASPYGDAPFGGRFDIGFRVVRRDAGTKPPTPGQTATPPDIPSWTIAENAVSKSFPDRQMKTPPGRDLFACKPIPAPGIEVGIREVTFAEWKPVYDWAVARGYKFNNGGEMGSMAYWGFGDGWEPGAHGPDEPVTGITSYDMVVWLNALSELEGRTPAYYADDACAQPIKAAFEYQPLQLLLGEGEKLMSAGTLSKSRADAFQEFRRKEAADGYRLPTYEEFKAAIFSGKKLAPPWGNDPKALFGQAWTADSSGFRTHPAGTTTPDAAGISDLIGNVAEITLRSGEGLKGDLTQGYTTRTGGSFMDPADGLFEDAMFGKPTAAGLAYPDVGFRIARPAVKPPGNHGENSGLRQGGNRRMEARAVSAGPPYHGDEVGASRREAPNIRVGARIEGSSVKPEPAAGPAPPGIFGRLAHAASDLPIPALVSTARALEPEATTPPGRPKRTGKPAANRAPESAVAPEPFDDLQGRVHRANLRRDGLHRASGLPTAKGVQWKFQTGGPVRSSPVVVDGVVYVGSHDGFFYAIDAATGAPRWKYQTADKISGSAAVVDGAVFFAGEDGFAHAVRAADGSPLWKGELGGKSAGSPAILDGVVYIGSARNGGEVLGMTARPILGLDAKTGKQVWQTKTPGPQGYAAISTDGARLFAGTNGSNYGAFDLRSGSQAWDAKGGHQNRQFMSMTVAGGAVYIATTMRGAVMAVDPAGKKLWFTAMLDGQLDIELNQGGRFGYECFTDVAVAEGLVLAGSNDGRLYAFDAKTGAKTWNFPTAGKVQSSPSIAAGIAYFGSWDGNLYALDLKTGAPRWKLPLGGRIISSPWPGEGAIYVGCDDGCIRAIH